MNALKEKAAQEAKHCHRLSIHNEELQWKLKQNSERYQTTLQELSKSFHDRSSYMRSDDDLAANSHSGDESTVSPPASPRVKGIVETSDAVSYILEIDDESPGQVASKAIRRMGSFRSSPVNVLKRSKSSSQSPMANPLSQSASATAIMRQFSAENSPMRNGGAQEASSSASSALRTRSKSMSIKSTGSSNRRLTTNKVQATGGGGDLETTILTAPQPIHSSSPYKMENGGSMVNVMEGEKKRSSAIKNLSFTRSRATSFGAVPKVIPTMARDTLPQESAGEAMILHISDGEDVSSLTASTSSQSSSEEETTAEKDRTAISIQRQASRGMEEMLHASLHNGSGFGGSTSRSGSNLIITNGEEGQEQQRQQWSPTRILEGEEVAMEEEEDEDEEEEHSESVV